MPFPYSFDAVIGIFIAGYSEDRAPRILRSLSACVDHLADGRVMQVELSTNFSQRVPIIDMRRSDALVPLGASHFSDP